MPPTAPDNLELLNKNNTITLCWKSSTDNMDKLTSHPVTYAIEVSTDNGITWLPYIDGIQGLYYILETLECGIPYHFRVKSHNRFGYSEATNAVKFVRGSYNKF